MPKGGRGTQRDYNILLKLQKLRHYVNYSILKNFNWKTYSLPKYCKLFDIR